MQLNYDIDFGEAGSEGLHFATFRDPATAQAAARASARTKSILHEAGIGLGCVASGFPAGYYALEHESSHAYLMACLIEAITCEADHGEAARDGEFDLAQCLVHLSAVRPYGALMVASDEAQSPAASPDNKTGAAAVMAISVLAAAGYVAGFAILS
ncbi:MAG: hypothetical protein AAF841_00085 [Pseudomonadota bacterium]